METEEMKCEKCGGTMKKVDENTMECDGCGVIKKIEEKKEEEAK